MPELLHLETFGNPQNSPIIFLHGFMGSSADWEAVISSLMEDFYCVAVDLPGHGQSPLPSADQIDSFPQVAEFILSQFHNRGLEKSFLVGYSLGGRLALYLALHFPGHFRRVVLESASPGLASREERIQRQKQDEALIHRLETGDFGEFLRSWYEQPLFRSLKAHPHFEKLLAKRMKNDPKKLARALRLLGSGWQPSLWDQLKVNKIPLLLLAGEFDVKFQKIAGQMKRLCPAAQTEIVEGAGHNIHWEQPELFIKRIREFFTI
ncbi:MAG: 2-succinyl-6-hydroxy-2,4-cyclohexadiene-1-carboxy late synthase [Calditrichia bacterium]